MYSYSNKLSLLFINFFFFFSFFLFFIQNEGCGIEFELVFNLEYKNEKIGLFRNE
jgi:hypothetical protein